MRYPAKRLDVVLRDARARNIHNVRKTEEQAIATVSHFTQEVMGVLSSTHIKASQQAKEEGVRRMETSKTKGA